MLNNHVIWLNVDPLRPRLRSATSPIGRGKACLPQAASLPKRPPPPEKIVNCPLSIVNSEKNCQLLPVVSSTLTLSVLAYARPPLPLGEARRACLRRRVYRNVRPPNCQLSIVNCQFREKLLTVNCYLSPRLPKVFPQKRAIILRLLCHSCGF